MSQEKNLGSSDHDITVVRASALDSPDDYVTHKGHSMDTPVQTVEYPQDENDDPNRKKKKWWSIFLEPGSAPQIIVAAVLAIAIGMAVNATVDKVPKEAVEIVGIPGRIWLRALTA
jgi:hypothetical protein